MTYTLHPATENDIPAIQKIARQFSSELGFVMRVSLVNAIGKSELTIARSDDGTIIGFINWHRRRDNITTVYEIAVSKNCQQQGIGKALIASVPTPVRLKVTQDNPANGFYQHIGMTLIATETGRKRPLNVYALGTDDEIRAMTAPRDTKEERKRKQREKQREKYANMTPEEREARLAKNREWYQNLSPEQKKERANYSRQYEIWRRMHMTPDEREKQREKWRINRRKYWWAMSDDERQARYDARNARERERRAKMTPEEREAYNAQRRVYYRRWINGMSPSKRRQYFRERALRIPPERLVEYRRSNYEKRKRLRFISVVGA